MKKRGFTLVEILMVVAIVGVIASAAMAPLVFSVMRLIETEEQYTEEEALSRVVALVVRETREAMRTALSPIIRVLKDEKLGAEPDYSLVVATISPAKQNLPAGCVVYRVVRKNAFSKLPSGLYRWVLPGKYPSAVDVGKLDEEGAQLVLTELSEFKIETLLPPDWIDSYNGDVPAGMRFTLARGEQRVEQVEWFPK